MKTVIRYANRKLYDKDAHRYISLKDVSEFVKADVQFVVVHNVSKEDITRKTVQDALCSYSELDLEVMRHMIKNEVNETL